MKVKYRSSRSPAYLDCLNILLQLFICFLASVIELALCLAGLEVPGIHYHNARPLLCSKLPQPENCRECTTSELNFSKEKILHKPA